MQRQAEAIPGCLSQRQSPTGLAAGWPPSVADNSLAACSNLYDVFNNIRLDEEEHVKTMTACRDYSIVDDLVQVSTAKTV